MARLLLGCRRTKGIRRYLLKSGLLSLYDSRLLDGDLGIRLREWLTCSHLKLSERIEGALILEMGRIWTEKFLQSLSRKWTDEIYLFV
jgi:hypothetical protein